MDCSFHITSRAVHESSDACIICLRNFISFKGVHTRIRFDTNFIGVKGKLTNAIKLFEEAAVKCFMSSKGIEWVMMSCCVHDRSWEIKNYSSLGNSGIL